MVETPVVLIAFNRLDLTARNLDVLRKVQPSQVFLVCDGPRANRVDDEVTTAAVRKVLAGIDWPAEVHRRFSSSNLGCEANVELGLDWVFSRVDRAIVLEDDCLPDATFFRYCDELLDRYAGDPRVWHIAGNRHDVPTRLFNGDSYAFSTWASVWGWATWSDRWQHHRKLFPRDHQSRGGRPGNLPFRTSAAVPRPGTLMTRGGERHFVEAAASTDVISNGWDKHWWLSIISSGGLSATPSINLVENAGFGPAATHGVSDSRQESASAMDFPLRHPATVDLNHDVERELELVLSRVGGPAARVARRVVRSPGLRRLIRTFVRTRFVAAVMRSWAQLQRGGRLAGRSHPVIDE